jgi:hypothetical protein
MKNDAVFVHKSGNGTCFQCERADLKGHPIEIAWPADGDKLLSDVAEMIGRHASSVLPNLQNRGGFAGYDKIKFVRRPHGK